VKVTVNGKAVDVKDRADLWHVVRSFTQDPEAVIVELNENVIKRNIWTETILAEGDRIELVSLVGGG
jgi:sulfur carrier protein